MKNNLPSTKYLIALLGFALLPLLSFAQPYVIIPPDGNRVAVEKILARPNGDIVVTINNQPRDIAKDQYIQAVGVKPAGIDQAQALINEGKTEEASKLLTDAMQGSRYLSWDAFAGEKLAGIQLAAGEPLQAKRTLDTLERRYGDNMITLFPFLEKVQWDVKVVSNDTVGLEDELTGIVLGENVAAERKARALIVRGDLKASRKDFKSAVLDYMRANYFFGENPGIQAEALYKTAVMFSEIGDTGRLRKYSTLLKEKYPDSEFNSREIGS